MNNPLIPQGSLLEQKARNKPHLRVATFIVAAHVVFLGFILLSQGCKRDDTDPTKTGAAATNDAVTALPPLTQETLYTAATNAMAQQTTNVPALGLATSNTLPLQNTEPALLPIDAPSAAQEYVVVKGDSFYTIGRKFGVTAAAIARANPGVDSTRLKIGQKLTIPPPAPANGSRTSVAEATLGGAGNVYVVKSGDTLSKIARDHGVTVNEIKALNGLATDRINAGQKLKLPAAPATTPETNPAPLPGPGSGTGNL